MAPRSRKSEQRARPKRVAEPAGFKSLSKADQVRYLQKLWDSIADGPGQLPVPKAHLSLAKERLTAYRLVAAPRADLDVAAAYQWYESERAGLRTRSTSLSSPT